MTSNMKMNAMEMHAYFVWNMQQNITCIEHLKYDSGIRKKVPPNLLVQYIKGIKI